MYLAAAAKSLQSCPTLCDPIDGSPPGSPVPGILQARTLECVAINFSNAWKWKMKVKSLSRVWLLATPWTAAYQAPPSMGFFPGKSNGVGCHCLLQVYLDFPSIHNFSLGPGAEKAEVVWETAESFIGVFQEDKWASSNHDTLPSIEGYLCKRFAKHFTIIAFHPPVPAGRKHYDFSNPVTEGT